MIDKIKAKSFFHSLYVKLILVIIVGVGASVGVFTLARSLSVSYINKHYVTHEQRTHREQEYISDLREFIRDNDISSEDTSRIAEWAQNNKYVYLLVYKNNVLLFSSDMIPEKPSEDPEGDVDNNGDSSDTEPDGDKEDSKPVDDNNNDGSSLENEDNAENGEQNENSDSAEKEESGESNKPGGSIGSGITVAYPTREELKKYAEENDLYELETKDGVLLASVAEFTEYLYFDIVNIVSLILAMVVLSAILINYMRRIVARVKRLDRNVMVVADGSINMPIESNGYDEIARLSENVENMRCTILESIEEERRARQANTELITAMSHDIRTPLTVLLGYLDIMKGEAQDEIMRSYVEATEKTALRLKNLSDDMFNYFLAFGNTEETVNIEEYDAATLFEQILSEHLLLLEEKGYDVRLKSDEKGFVSGSIVRTDAPKLMRIVDNIFSNVAKYADSTKPVFVDAMTEDGVFVLRVKNTISNSSRAESNGIGLKTCKRLAPFIAESFECGEHRDCFSAELKVKFIPPEK